MSDREHTTVRLRPGLMMAVKLQQERERRQSQTEMIAVLLERGLEMSDVLHFNRACTIMGITTRREQFSDYRKARGISEYQTADEWTGHAAGFRSFCEWCKALDVPAYESEQELDHYLESFDNDAADEKAMQEDARA